MILRAILIAAVLALTGVRTEAREVAGVDLPETKSVSGKDLQLNGAGVRTATMLKVKVYVAALYTPTALKTFDELLASEGPLRLDLTYVRAFNQEKTQEAWRWQFEQSNEHTYPGFERDRDQVVASFGPIKKFGVESVEIVGDETRIYDHGVLKTTIKGKDFQKSVLSLWFGSKPVMPELKAALLGGKKSR